MITEIVLTEARLVGKENEVIAAAGLGAAQAGVESAKEQASALWASLKGKAEGLSDTMQAKRTEADEAALQKRIVEITGRRATRLILDRNDEPIVNQGDIITHAAIQRARESGALELLLKSVEDDNEDWPPPPIVVGEAVVTPEPESDKYEPKIY